MNFEELLKAQGLTEEQIAKITAGMSENKLFLTSDENLSERYSRMKEQRDEARSQLKERDEQITALGTQITEKDQALSENQEALANIDDLKAQLEAAQNEKSEFARNIKLEKILEKAGVSDIEYIKWKLEKDGALEVDENGEFTKVENTLKDYQTSLPNYFPTVSEDEEKDETDTGLGYKPLDSKLKPGSGEGGSDPFNDVMAKYK